MGAASARSPSSCQAVGPTPDAAVLPSPLPDLGPAALGGAAPATVDLAAPAAAGQQAATRSPVLPALLVALAGAGLLAVVLDALFHEQLLGLLGRDGA